MSRTWVAGSAVPRTRARLPSRSRFRLSVRLSRASTVILRGGEASAARAASPAKTARRLPLPRSSTVARQLPSTPATAVATLRHAAPVTAGRYSIARATPSGDEPSGNRSEPETSIGVTPRTSFGA